MDALNVDTQRDFVTRQYANLVAGGMDATAARARLQDVLGDTVLAYLGADAATADHSADRDGTARLGEAAQRLGGSVAHTQAAWIESLSEARLFALDWWRPARTFLLYIVFLLGLAVLVAVIYSILVLPAFSHLDAAMGMGGQGAAAWIQAKGEIRLFAPLLVMAVLLALLATLWWRMRMRLGRLEPLAGQARLAWLYGRSGATYQVLCYLEYACALAAGGVAGIAALQPARQLVDWPTESRFHTVFRQLGERLEQAARLDTFDAELAWQRRLHWSTAQAQLELARDRLILFSRVVFYILIGIMVTVLYVPIFSVASFFGG